MSAEFVKKPTGLLYLAELILGLIAGFILQFIWDEYGNVSISLINAILGGQTFVYLALFLTNLAVLAVVVMEINQAGTVDSFGKLKVMIFHVVCAILLFVAAGLESYYMAKYPWWRRTFAMILLWILAISHVAQIVIAFMCT